MRLFGSLDGYQRPWLGGDLIAGLTLWAILVPQALAYASIANVSPVVGLYAAPGALLLYAALGSSRVLVMGPMGPPRRCRRRRSPIWPRWGARPSSRSPPAWP